jgi:hypothetical protein
VSSTTNTIKETVSFGCHSEKSNPCAFGQLCASVS